MISFSKIIIVTPFVKLVQKELYEHKDSYSMIVKFWPVVLLTFADDARYVDFCVAECRKKIALVCLSDVCSIVLYETVKWRELPSAE